MPSQASSFASSNAEENREFDVALTILLSKQAPRAGHGLEKRSPLINRVLYGPLFPLFSSTLPLGTCSSSFSSLRFVSTYELAWHQRSRCFVRRVGLSILLDLAELSPFPMATFRMLQI